MMAIDLLGAIIDPDMGGCAFSYGRIVETVNARGRAEYTEDIIQAVGNIQSAPGKERELLDDADRLKAVILVYAPAPLTAGRGRIKADRIFYQGDAYRVVLAEPWREHAGFTKALAVLEREGEDE
jgi:hypothetical protein